MPRDDAQVTLRTSSASTTSAAERRICTQGANQTRLAAAGRTGQHEQSLRRRQMFLRALLRLLLLMLVEKKEVRVQPVADLADLARMQTQIALVNTHGFNAKLLSSSADESK